jgi:hypothetical protein
VPYSDTTITTERFKKNEPSGVLQETVRVLVDGVPATAFFGQDPIPGDTREYGSSRWRPKELDAWLAEIMSTWKFLSNSAGHPQTISPLVLSTIANSSLRSASGTLNFAMVSWKSLQKAVHSLSVILRCLCDSLIARPVYFCGRR